MSEELDDRQRSEASFQTLCHIGQVRARIREVIALLYERWDHHDESKLEPPEEEAFARALPRLRGTFGTEAYDDALKELGAALPHHYAVNRHHPEHFDNGVDGMTLVDVVEMLCDWIASAERDGGDIRRSIEANARRFHLSDQLRRILDNTADLLAPGKEKP